MMEKLVQSNDEGDAEGDVAQHRHQEQNNNLEDADLGSGDAIEISSS
jgi:hypothetical protein